MDTSEIKIEFIKKDFKEIESYYNMYRESLVNNPDNFLLRLHTKSEFFQIKLNKVVVGITARIDNTMTLFFIKEEFYNLKSVVFKAAIKELKAFTSFVNSKDVSLDAFIENSAVIDDFAYVYKLFSDNIKNKKLQILHEYIDIEANHNIEDNIIFLDRLSIVKNSREALKEGKNYILKTLEGKRISILLSFVEGENLEVIMGTIKELRHHKLAKELLNRRLKDLLAMKEEKKLNNISSTISAKNIAAIKLAESVGFIRYSKIYSISFVK